MALAGELVGVRPRPPNGALRPNSIAGVRAIRAGPSASRDAVVQCGFRHLLVIVST